VIDRVVYDSYEPLLALAMAAAVTERIELVTNVVIAPLRNTRMLAKQAASLDRASGGRLTLGLALGGRDDDFVACGLPTRERGRRLDAQLGELRRIWQDTDIGPAPARPGGPRVLVGGDARYAGPRAARHGDGWTMMVGTPADFAAGIEVVRGCWTAASRPGTPATTAVFYAALGDDAPHLVEKAIGGYYVWLGRDTACYIVGTAATSEAQVHERLVGFAAAGADEVMVLPCAEDPGQLERLAAVAVPGPLRGHPQPERPADVPDWDAARQAWHSGEENVAPAPSSRNEHGRTRTGPPPVSPADGLRRSSTSSLASSTTRRA